MGYSTNTRMKFSHQNALSTKSDEFESNEIARSGSNVLTKQEKVRFER